MGTPTAAEWVFDFPASLPMTPPTRVYLPAWTFDRAEQVREARAVLRILADIEFRAHDCDRCGSEHRLITRAMFAW